jgi:hypothetical protein
MTKFEIEKYHAALKQLESGKRLEIGGIQIGEIGNDGWSLVDQTQSQIDTIKSILTTPSS